GYQLPFARGPHREELHPRALRGRSPAARRAGARARPAEAAAHRDRPGDQAHDRRDAPQSSRAQRRAARGGEELMARANIALLALVIACALAVITSQHRARLAFVALEAEQEAARKLEEEWTQLQLEQSTGARNKRVESIAAAKLGMRLPDASNTVVVTVEAAPGAAPTGDRIKQP